MKYLVHGPASVQLGFSGASIAAAISYNFVAISASLYILFKTRMVRLETAVGSEQHKRERPSMLRGLGLILLLGMGGVGTYKLAYYGLRPDKIFFLNSANRCRIVVKRHPRLWVVVTLVLVDAVLVIAHTCSFN